MEYPDFPFPFQAYPIQEKFMRKLYYTVETCKSGIFESPTGTGKSLSICCSVLQWLCDHNSKLQEDLNDEINQLKLEISAETDANDWLQEEYEKIQKNQKLATLQMKLEKIKQQKEFYKDMKKRVMNLKSKVNGKKMEYFQIKSKETGVAVEDKETSSDVDGEQYVDDLDLLLHDVGDDEQHSDDELEDKDDNDDDLVKIYISSRTHSQLSQFVGEIKRTAFKEDTRVVTLASRQHYCINYDVSKLKNINLINERCLDLQKSSTKTSAIGEEGKVLKKSKTKSCSSCPYYNQTNIGRLKEQMLVDIMDMEDLVKCGNQLKACPYYATRMALKDAQVVLISHAGIVSAGARSGVSLKLNNNILILDEAHGLTAALESAHSAPVSLKKLDSVKTYLNFYIHKYRARLSSKNLLLLNQICFVVNKFLGMITIKEGDKSMEGDTTIFTLEDFVIKAEIDHLNLRPLVEFSRNTKLAPKLHGFSMKYNEQAMEELNNKNKVTKSSFETFLNNISKTKVEEKVVEEVKIEAKTVQQQASTETSAGSSLYAILDFIERLCDRSENGRVLALKGTEQSGLLKYLLLNPADHFVDVVRQCRSVIVAGGTMEPISEFQTLLTGSSKDDNDNITIVRCDHVVPSDNVLAVCLSKGPSNVSLNFSYENRLCKKLLDETGSILRNLCNIIPGGVVCFFPSYSYEQTVYEHLTSTNVIECISKKKQVYREPKSAADVDSVLNKFAESVRKQEHGRNGALLLSVVGGKLSEGLNFSDELGRCVIVVGMPYPNVKSPELHEKMNYLNRTQGAGAGSLYYENLCMKAVNQCIGRAVRHAKDYACVVLMDERYSRAQTGAMLPSFLQKSLMVNCSFGPTIGKIARFFSKHKKNQ